MQWRTVKLYRAIQWRERRSAEDHAPAAFSASFLASRPLASDLLGRPEGEGPAALAHPVLDMLSAKTGEVMTEESAEVSQKALGLTIDKRNEKRLQLQYLRVTTYVQLQYQQKWGTFQICGHLLNFSRLNSTQLFKPG